MNSPDSRSIQRGPARIDLATVERLLLEHLAVESAAAVASSRAGGPEHIVAFVVPSAEADTVDGTELRRRLSMRVALVFVPTRIEVVSELPIAANGRVDWERLSHRATRRDRPIPESSGLEAEIVSLWSIALGAVVSPTDDYFELGGDFPLAIRTSNLVENFTGRRVPPSHLRTNPTAASLAAHAMASGKDPDSTAVFLTDAEGVDPLTVIAYDMDGSAFQMADLAAETGLDRVCGLDLPAMAGTAQAGRTLPEVAAKHVEDLLAIDPAGPRVVLGYSLGAILAHELACQLHDAGRPPDMVGLIDLGPVHVGFDMGRRGIRPAEAWPWRPPGTDRRPVRWAKYLRHAADLPRGARVEYLARAANLGRDWDTARAERDLRVTGRVRPTLRRPWAWYRLMEATVDHRPRRYPGDIVLFICDQTVKGNIPTDRRVSHASKLEPTLGWAPYVEGELRLWPVVGVHTDLIEPPYVAGLGLEVRRAIEGASRG